MANPAHLEKLCEGPRAWNEWRDANPNVLPDLTEIELTLHQRQLGPSNGGPIDLRLADLERASLPYATLSGADLEGARLVGMDLTHARLDGARLIGADLTDAILDQADLTGAVLDHVVLFGTQLSNARNLTAAQLTTTYGDANTRLPDNLQAPESWFPGSDYGDADEDEYAGWGSPVYEEPEQDLYEALGLTPQAQTDEIRTSFRNLVKKLHPDLNPDDQAAQERFKRVTTAYRILNDQEKRRRYDRGEIDGQGRVNPEFEARRRFRRAAVRYYAAAALSFLVAGGALATVWHMFLSSDAEKEVAVVSQPKRGERLGGNASAPAKPAKTEQAASGGMNAVREAVSEGWASSPASTDTQAGNAANQETPAAAEQQPITAPEKSAQDVPIGGKEARAREEQSQESQTSSEHPALAFKATGQPAPWSPAAENTRRPLPRLHKDWAGQTSSSAPDQWSVAALQHNDADRKARPSAELHLASTGGERLPPPSQQPMARDIVSKVLRSRALDHALGKARRSVTASDNAPFPLPHQRRVDLLPTSATLGKSASSSPKRSAAASGQPQQRKAQTARSTTIRSQATASTTASNGPFDFGDSQ